MLRDLRKLHLGFAFCRDLEQVLVCLLPILTAAVVRATVGPKQDVAGRELDHQLGRGGLDLTAVSRRRKGVCAVSAICLPTIEALRRNP
jgi:hypothetical protein